MSQPSIRDIPAGNILLSAAILFSGATPGKVLRLLNHMQVACISDRTFYRHQARFLEPAVLAVWEVKQSRLLAECKAHGNSLNIGGDGRADSPGHSAKYGSYTLIDLDTNKVLHIELVQVKQKFIELHCSVGIKSKQSNEVKSSNAMEKEGLCRAIEFLSANSLNINTLVTDRHNQISKFVCKKHPSIEHHYDVRHVSKGMLA